VRDSCLLLFSLVAAAGMTAAVGMREYGALPDGRPVHAYTLENKGVRVVVLDYGAILAEVHVPDRAGRVADIALGYDSLGGWLPDQGYMGATVGRYANRIGGGKFSLDGRSYTLAVNNPPNHLHGGRQGFNQKLWSGKVVRRDVGEGVELEYLSPDGEEGYPGNLRATVTYLLTAANELRIEFAATTDHPTVVNLTNHAYWNLTGDARTPILGHELTLHARSFLPVASGIPTGEFAPVTGTPFDFTAAKPVGRDIVANHEQLRQGFGYDHCWVVEGTGLRRAAFVHDPVSGRTLELLTDQPGLQFYTGNWLNGVGKGGVAYRPRTGLCLEPQNFPDSPNIPAFPTATLRPGETYRHTSVYRFGAR
jgi:aldose 1-epimerase